MSAEIWQFTAFLGVVAVVFVLWLSIIYLPGRTLERRYDSEDDSRRSYTAYAQGANAPREEEISQSSSGQTR